MQKQGVAIFFTLQFNPIYCVCVCVCGAGSKAPFITFQVFSFGFELAMQDSLQVFIVLKPSIICTFLIRSGILQKMLTALVNLVWNTQKSKRTVFFECQGTMFLSIEKVLKKISEDQP